MSPEIQQIIVYAIVVLAIAALVGRGIRRRRRLRRLGGSPCGPDCGCPTGDGVRRNPVIEDVMRRERKKRKENDAS